MIKVNPSDAAAYFNLANLSLLTQQLEKGHQWVEQGLSKTTGLGLRTFPARLSLRSKRTAK